MRSLHLLNFKQYSLFSQLMSNLTSKMNQTSIEINANLYFSQIWDGERFLLPAYVCMMGGYVFTGVCLFRGGGYLVSVKGKFCDTRFGLIHVQAGKNFFEGPPPPSKVEGPPPSKGNIF